MNPSPAHNTQRGVLRLSGEIDLFRVGELREELANMVRKDYLALFLDLSLVTFLDSSALSVVIDYWRQMNEDGCKLVIVGAKGEVSEIFHLTNLDQLIPLFPTEKDACSALDLVA